MIRMEKNVNICRRGDSNPYVLNGHWNLNPARLPFPPLRPELEYSLGCRIVKLLPSSELPFFCRFFPEVLDKTGYHVILVSLTIYAHVAQAEEHILGKDEVTGSIPVVGSENGVEQE